ncbi:hypothetical protein OZ664_04125 [Elizabethkingia sp. HX WHF]|uniref:hypothetical protein n=1 Tax=Elizabethkingia TaxID=308865 RepID=UPI00099A8719|nr:MULTISPECIES: hypothetical protein [Elizabethkingia]ATL42952.1 hypothetical protein CQS02_06310 [Elizabethkingia miricola]MCT3945000.1 hypothetical protein [Elizabethkingia anophelis]MCL1637521.1 hypothetical protein [Elizabethkingia bruuniana]MCT3994779.1 hypothetical protein [Elizabethkingia anophelis]MCT3998269.1 hypothetical protein [Elizabethkingia anophelis]
MSKYSDIKKILDSNISKKTYKELCLDENTGNSMIKSLKVSYSYDDICQDIKTSDTVLIFDDSIHFVEFKDVKYKRLKSDRDFIRQLRLKVSESFVTFYNFLNENSYELSKDEVSELTLDFLFVFNREHFLDKPTLLNTFSATQRKWTAHYQRFYRKISFIDNETFSKKYKL